jgi:phage terminase large subunit
MATAKIRLPPKLARTFAAPRGSVLYRAMKGGRGSAKSYSAALMAAAWGYAEPLRILCTREYQASIKESFHAELKNAIGAHDWLTAHYDVGVDYLRGRNGTEFIFRGLRHSASSIKSLANIDLTIVEEAEDVPEASWLALEATVFRRPKAELWPIWNPRLDGSPVDQRFVKNPPKRAHVVHVNWSDNPFFPPELNELRKREQARLDPNTYAHVWEGAYLTNSNAQILAGKYEIAEHTPAQGVWDGPYFGGDFGFSSDPTAAVEAWISGDTLYVTRELYQNKLEIDDTAAAVIRAMPLIEGRVSRWDSARPESISYLRRHGLEQAVAVEKWPGSVEDGIAFLRSFRRIVIHPRCVNIAREARLYSYKVDRLSGDVTTDIVDAHNHAIDALRYAVGPMIRRKGAVVHLL